MPHPTLFIGIGGSGVKTVSHIKRNLVKAKDWKAVQPYYRFLLLDTDNSERDKLRTTFAREFNASTDFIDFQKEWFSLGGFNPQNLWSDYKKEPKNPIHGWIDPAGAAIFPGTPIEIGANANRQLGRTCFYHHFGSLATRIQALLEDLNPLRGSEQAERVHIYLVAGSGGGTGSSAFYDFIYLLWAVHSRIAAGAEPLLRPIVYSPQPFIKLMKAKNFPAETIMRVQANAYAFFLELQYALRGFCDGRTDTRKDFLSPDWNNLLPEQRSWRPFDGLMVVDPQIDGTPPRFVPLDEFYPLVAELVASMARSGTDRTVLGQWTNNNLCSEIDRETHTPPAYMAAGFRTVEFPSSPLQNYVASRFAYDLIRERYRRPNGATQAELRAAARDIVVKEIVSPYGYGPDGLRPGESFCQRVHNEFLSTDASSLLELGSISEFLRLSGSESDTRTVDLNLVTKETLDQGIDAVRGAVGGIKRGIREQFEDRYGKFAEGTGPEPGDTGYGRLWERLCREMEERIEQQGIFAWTGSDDLTTDGLSEYLVDECTALRQAATIALTASTQRVQETRSRLDFAKVTALESAGRAAGLKKILPGRANELRGALESYALLRVEWLKEEFNNVCLMGLIELLTFVGSDDDTVETQEFFRDQGGRYGPSMLRRLKDQGYRIRDWLSGALTSAMFQMESTASHLEHLRRSLITQYEPPLTQVMDERKNPGPLSVRALELLRSRAADFRTNSLQEFASTVGEPSMKWRRIRAASFDPDERAVES
nr:tubulin-like doman-containing protein [Gemmatimonadota bacterium]